MSSAAHAFSTLGPVERLAKVRHACRNITDDKFIAAAFDLPVSTVRNERARLELVT